MIGKKATYEIGKLVTWIAAFVFLILLSVGLGYLIKFLTKS